MSDCLTCATPNELKGNAYKCLKPFPGACGSICIDCASLLVGEFAQQFRRCAAPPPPTPTPTGLPTATGEAPVLTAEVKAA